MYKLESMKGSEIGTKGNLPLSGLNQYPIYYEIGITKIQFNFEGWQQCGPLWRCLEGVWPLLRSRGVRERWKSEILTLTMKVFGKWVSQKCGLNHHHHHHRILDTRWLHHKGLDTWWVVGCSREMGLECSNQMGQNLCCSLRRLHLSNEVKANCYVMAYGLDSDLNVGFWSKHPFLNQTNTVFSTPLKLTDPCETPPMFVLGTCYVRFPSLKSIGWDLLELCELYLQNAVSPLIRDYRFLLTPILT